MKSIRLAVRVLPLAGLIALAGCGGGSASAGSTPNSPSGETTVTSGHIAGQFTATVVQGPDTGKVYHGTLSLDGAAKGHLQGSLAADAGAIPASGQLDGQLIGVSLTVAPGKTISGTGVVGYDAATKTNTIGGTFSGPSDTSVGTWELVGGPAGLGGCLEGIKVGSFTKNGVVSAICYVSTR